MSDPNYLNSLLPNRKKKNISIIIPLILIVLIVSASAWAYLTYVQPTYDKEQETFDNNQKTLQSFEGELVVEKTEEEDCFKLKMLNEETNIYSTLCVPEETFNANTENTTYVYVPVTS